MKRKVTTIVTYHDTTIHNITFVLRDGEPLEMYSARTDIVRPQYQSFTHMYNAVLILARNNSFTIPYHNEFGTRWYNILWCDTERPYDMHRMAYHGNYGTF